MKKISLFIGLIAILLTLLLCCNTTVFSALAIDSSSNYSDVFYGYSKGLSNTDIFNQTNTFNYCGVQQDNSYYDTLSRNSEKVDNSLPMITVLTHGLGGDASHWSNNTNDAFAYSSTSLISQLDRLALLSTDKSANLYWARFDSTHNFKLYDLNRPENKDSTGKYVRNQSVEKLTDISKHIIIIFEASNGGASNNAIYEEFNYMLSKIIYDVKVLNGGYLPKINLIGHSRGGITNLQYALDHPDLVDSLFSMGTPYFGSDTASTNLGADIGGNVDDIIDRTVFQGYFDRWYNNYSSLYSHIHGYALGGYSNTDFIFNRLLEDMNTVQSYAPWLSSELLTAGKIAVDSLPILPLAGTVVYSAIATSEIYTAVGRLFFRYGDFQESEVASIAEILNDISYYDPNGTLIDNAVAPIPVVGSPFFMNDLLVDLSSQLGYDSHSSYIRDYGFTLYAKQFKEDNCDLSKCAVHGMPTIVHNLEPQDAELIGYILANINIGTGHSEDYYYWSEKNDGTITLEAYYGRADLKTVQVPEYINNKKVTSIGEWAYAYVFYDVQPTTVYIPASVVEIAPYAFSECDSIRKVIFDDSTSLRVIGESAFEGCTQLSEFVWKNTVNRLPDSVTAIGDSAFMYCAFPSMHLNKNLCDIGAGAFAYNPNLSTITIDSGNKYFVVLNSVIYDKNKTKIIAAAPKNGMTELNMPDSVRYIEAYAFTYHNTLSKVYLPPYLERIGSFAFYGIGQNNPSYTSLSIFANLNGNTPLLGYYAFGGLKSNTSIFLPEDWWDDFQNSDFEQYSNYFKLFYITVQYTVKKANGTYTSFTRQYANGSYTTFENIIPSNYGYTGYRFDGWCFGGSNIAQPYYPWPTYRVESRDYSDLFATASIVIDDYVITFDELQNKYHLQYGDTGFRFATPSKRGYTFQGWADSKGIYYTDASGYACRAWNKTSDTTLYAKWSPIRYCITYNLNGGTMSASTTRYYYITDATFYTPTPTKTDCTFAGWKATYGTVYSTITPSTLCANITLTAQWNSQPVYYCSTGRSITAENSIININGSAGNTYVFTIASNITHVKFYGNSKNYTNFRIEIANRSSDLFMTFNNMNITAPAGKSAIQYTGSTYFEMWLDYEGTNTITGGMGLSQTTLGASGNAGLPGIDFTGAYLDFRRNSGTLTVTGGKGGNGGTGLAGATGAQGSDVTGIFLGNGGNGSTGGTGGTGGKGGNGGVAVKAKYLYIYSSCSGYLTLKGGQGGDGGTGGRGGDGGRGGHGAGSALIPKDGGDGGNGGQGGTGGVGGAGGAATSVTGSAYYTNYASNLTGTTGVGGRGGNGGNGGMGGANGPSLFADGSYGKGGKGGAGGTGGAGSSKGSSGCSGTSDPGHYYRTR